jgi:TonB family protein
MKIDKINYYIVLSLLIHSFLLLFTLGKNNKTLGDKIIPVEIIDNLIESGVGEATKRSKRVVNMSPNKQISKKLQTIKKSSENFKSFESKLEINNKSIDSQNKQENTNNNSLNVPNQSFSGERIGSGSRLGTRTNEPEKGSLKGFGKLKITCRKCIRPQYPPLALRRGAEGKPIVKVWIDKSGKVIKTILINKSGIKSIDNAAEKAAINSTFYPIEKESTLNIEYDLKIK